MNRSFILLFGLALVSLLFVGCVSSNSQDTTPSLAPSNQINEPSQQPSQKPTVLAKPNPSLELQGADFNDRGSPGVLFIDFTISNEGADCHPIFDFYVMKDNTIVFSEKNVKSAIPNIPANEVAGSNFALSSEQVLIGSYTVKVEVTCEEANVSVSAVKNLEIKRLPW